MTNKKDEGVIIIGHGSKSPSALKTLEGLVENVRKVLDRPIKLASLQFNKPTFIDAVEDFIKSGIDRIIVMPFFIYSGIHVTEDIPEAIEALKKKYEDVDFILAENLGVDPLIVSVVIDRISKVLDGKSSNAVPDLRPTEIEDMSFDIIRGKLPDLGSDLKDEVRMRIIHASGDITIERDILFSESFDSITEAIRAGMPVVTDVMMVLAGINKVNLNEFGSKVSCFIKDVDVIENSKLSQKTRAAASMIKASKNFDNAIFVIGNAPTALNELCDLFIEGQVKPSAIIGIPVGFVGAAESKDRLKDLEIPWVTIKGTRGGSAMAAAAFNAALKNVVKETSDVLT